MDKDVVLAAAKNNPQALQFAYGTLQLDKDAQEAIEDRL